MIKLFGEKPENDGKRKKAGKLATDEKKSLKKTRECDWPGSIDLSIFYFGENCFTAKLATLISCFTCGRRPFETV